MTVRKLGRLVYMLMIPVQEVSVRVLHHGERAAGLGEPQSQCVIDPLFHLEPVGGDDLGDQPHVRGERLADLMHDKFV